VRRALVITVSDRSSAGERADTSGPTAVEKLSANGFSVDEPVVIPDEKASIVGALEAAISNGIDLVVTTGGTGLSPRDVTPEATAEVVTMLVPGLAELMRAEGVKNTPLAALSRAICGAKGSTLVINLPGSPKGVAESLEAVLPVLPHALDVLARPDAH
jgi:molybdopterin adenylyltransferase